MFKAPLFTAPIGILPERVLYLPVAGYKDIFSFCSYFIYFRIWKMINCYETQVEVENQKEKEEKNNP